MAASSGSGRSPSGPDSLLPELGFELPPNPAAPAATPLQGPAAAPAKLPRDAAGWVAHIRDNDMPVFGATVALVHTVTEDEKASSARLAQVILQDSSMTAKVLKLANSAFYNPARQGVTTISRAIVVLGFDIVAEIAVGVMLVDAMLSGGVHKRVVTEMARSFHVAVQARSLAEIRRDPRAEEVFIAALLSRLGEMAFWCFGGAAAKRLDQLLSAGTMSEEDAQQASLGFRLRQLSLGLAREWRLGPLLAGVLEGRTPDAPAAEAIHLGQRLAVAVEKGWEGPQTRKVLAEMAAFTGESVEAVTERLANNAAEAARIATIYGAAEAARGIPLPANCPREALVEEVRIEADPMLQLKILREISGRIAAGAGVNEVLNLVLEGIYRGVGFDRVLFALLAPNRQQIVGKTGLGAGAEALSKHFVFTLQQPPCDLIDDLFRSPRVVELQPDVVPQGLNAERLLAVTGSRPACLAPIVAGGRAIGLFYADRSGDEPLGAEALDGFQLFVQQVSLAVSRLGAGRA